MAKKEVKTDLWVARQLDDSQIKYDAQGSNVKEINDALQSASKRGTGKVGYPEYVAVVKDFVIVIEDKADLTKHQKLTDAGILSVDQKDIANYAVNGAYFYAKHIAQNSAFHKIFAIGVAGDEKHHKITPLYVDDREGYKVLPDIESFTSFTVANIEEYYTRYVLSEKTDVEKTTEEILKDAAELHEYLRTYGSLKDQDKPLVVSGILLALDDKFFKPSDLLGDETTTDGQLIYDAIQRRLKASNVGPDAKRDKLMSEFSIIRTSARLNEIDQKLGKTPLKFYTEFLKKNVFDNIKYRSSSEDFIGRFYGEFMSYSGGDGQTLGIVLTPRHICDLFCDLLNIQATDIVLDPCCGTAGFLVAAMHHMLEKAGADQTKRKNIKKKQLHGFELQSNMFAIAATNMILRDDGNSNIKCEDFLRQNPAQVQLKFPVDTGKVVISEDTKSTLRNLFSGCRVNFLFGAGFSANLLGTLNNNEVIFEALQKYQAKNEDERKKVTILFAFLYWSFFVRCIEPISSKISTYDSSFDPYKEFGDIVYRIFSERGNPALDRQFSIFTTNYDPIIELIFDHSNCICNDGFEGRIEPRFATDNYSKTYYRQAIFSNRKAEIPSVNLLKLHGSVTWSQDIFWGSIIYRQYRDKIGYFTNTYSTLFDTTMVSTIDAHFTANRPDEANKQIQSLFASSIFDTLLAKEDDYGKFIQAYKMAFLIVNPTKEKFSDTLLNKNYYELLRIFSNELEKENSLLVVNGFSFRDEHILDLVKRSMVNPSLKILIFVYQATAIGDFQRLFGEVKNNNIIIIDEAHNVLSTTSERESQTWKDYRLETFEEIIKEGRKFGTFLTISSQRPSDISETIISQLHNYFIHRLVNNEDIRAIGKAVAFIDNTSYEMISVLPQGACIFTGVASNFPVLVQVDLLPKQQQPQSSTINLTELWKEP